MSSGDYDAINSLLYDAQDALISHKHDKAVDLLRQAACMGSSSACVTLGNLLKKSSSSSSSPSPGPSAGGGATTPLSKGSRSALPSPCLPSASSSTSHPPSASHTVAAAAAVVAHSPPSSSYTTAAASFFGLSSNSNNNTVPTAARAGNVDATAVEGPGSPRDFSPFHWRQHLLRHVYGTATTGHDVDVDDVDEEEEEEEVEVEEEGKQGQDGRGSKARAAARGKRRRHTTATSTTTAGTARQGGRGALPHPRADALESARYFAQGLEIECAKRASFAAAPATTAATSSSSSSSSHTPVGAFTSSARQHRAEGRERDEEEDVDHDDEDEHEGEEGTTFNVERATDLIIGLTSAYRHGILRPPSLEHQAHDTQAAASENAELWERGHACAQTLLAHPALGAHLLATTGSPSRLAHRHPPAPSSSSETAGPPKRFAKHVRSARAHALYTLALHAYAGGERARALECWDQIVHEARGAERAHKLLLRKRAHARNAGSTTTTTTAERIVHDSQHGDGAEEGEEEDMMQLEDLVDDDVLTSEGADMVAKARVRLQRERGRRLRNMNKRRRQREKSKARRASKDSASPAQPAAASRERRPSTTTAAREPSLPRVPSQESLRQHEERLPLNASLAAVEASTRGRRRTSELSEAFSNETDDRDDHDQEDDDDDEDLLRGLKRDPWGRQKLQRHDGPPPTDHRAPREERASSHAELSGGGFPRGWKVVDKKKGWHGVNKKFHFHADDDSDDDSELDERASMRALPPSTPPSHKPAPVEHHRSPASVMSREERVLRRKKSTASLAARAPRLLQLARAGGSSTSISTLPPDFFSAAQRAGTNPSAFRLVPSATTAVVAAPATEAPRPAPPTREPSSWTLRKAMGSMFRRQQTPSQAARSAQATLRELMRRDDERPPPPGMMWAFEAGEHINEEPVYVGPEGHPEEEATLVASSSEGGGQAIAPSPSITRVGSHHDESKGDDATDDGDESDALEKLPVDAEERRRLRRAAIKRGLVGPEVPMQAVYADSHPDGRAPCKKGKGKQCADERFATFPRRAIPPHKRAFFDPTTPSVAVTPPTPDKCKDQEQQPPREVAVDPFLLALEARSRVGGKSTCVSCGKRGHNFPACPRCRYTYCSRACRVGEGKGGDGVRHVCPQPRSSSSAPSSGAMTPQSATTA